MKRAFCLLALMGLSLPVHATEPCMYYAESEFIENVLKPSELVVYAEIDDYSDRGHQDPKMQWTKIKVITPLYAERAGKMRMHISGWQANNAPLYTYQKGDRIVLFLKRTGQNYVLTDNAWKRCTPSIWNANKDGKTYQGFKPEVDRQEWVVVEDLPRWIEKRKR